MKSVSKHRLLAGILMRRCMLPVLGCLVLTSLCVAAEPVVGIYLRPTQDPKQAILGFEGIKLALEENGYEDRVRYVADFDAKNLNDIRVLVLPCIYGYPPEWTEDQVAAGLRAFVEKGGGLLVFNESIGWRRAFAKRPPFPEIGRGTGKGDPYMDSADSGTGPMTLKYIFLEPADSRHPILQDIQGFFKVLLDTPEIVPGDKGTVVIKNKAGGAAALVVGQIGKGRVALIAPNLGIGLRNVEQPPTGNTLKLLLNLVRWAAGSP